MEEPDPRSSMIIRIALNHMKITNKDEVWVNNTSVEHAPQAPYET